VTIEQGRTKLILGRYCETRYSTTILEESVCKLEEANDTLDDISLVEVLTKNGNTRYSSLLDKR